MLTGAARRRLHVAAARNLAEWHTSCTRALGLHPQVDDHWWTCAMPAPNIYYSAISVAAAPSRRAQAAMADALAGHARDRSTSMVSVSDTWDELDLGCFGLQRRTAGSWFARAPTHHRPRPPLLGSDPSWRIDSVTDAVGLARFEAAMVAGFEARPPLSRFEIHAPGILEDPAMHVLGGWVGDELVACSMAYVTEVVGIYGVATLPGQRGHGYGSTMTDAAAAMAPDLVAVLQPTGRAEAMYRRLDFEPFGAFSHWA